ncbi:hypothetical protein ABTX81_12355 [Kitasatospora sp. NPDC097605]|uniref:hypothetical protein n=1 Tax=Kitasatospora sp. NPDC097605 TaxID=3157226 RepID=UPI00332E3415
MRGLTGPLRTKRWQRAAVAVWAVLVVVGGAVTLLLGDGRDDPAPRPPAAPGPSAPSGSATAFLSSLVPDPCTRPHTICAFATEAP